MTHLTITTYLRQYASAFNLHWAEPLVNKASDDAVCLEWWRGDRKLTIYIEDGKAEVLRVWGTNPDTEMANEIISTLSELEALWGWLVA
ncbi:MAG: hypothetical protein AAGD25_06750 [Cyanobacteria bacterium P01_F01_bin.150]